MKKILTLSLILLSFISIDSFAQNLYGGSAILYKEANLEEANLEEAGGNQSAIMFQDQTGNQVLDVSPDPESGGLSISVAGYQLVLSGKNDKSDSDIAGEVKTPKTRVKIKRPRYKGHLSTLEMGFNELTMLDYSAYPPGEQGFMELNNGRSMQVALNIFKVAAALNRAQTLGVSSSLGIVWNDYVFMNDITLKRGIDGMVHPEAIASTYKKTKLNTFALRIPLLLDLNFGKKFFLSAGFYGDLVLGSHTKYKFPKTKDRNPYINVFQAGGTVRGGYGNFYVYGNYSATNLFKGGKGPGAQPLTIGLGLGI
ncbi:MAG: outer membrane beta-barrel protein [Bacteroidales bacterium]|nr:outer membrane beta-barrel protein [Bacteroidales bacterium]